MSQALTTSTPVRPSTASAWTARLEAMSLRANSLTPAMARREREERIRAAKKRERNRAANRACRALMVARAARIEREERADAVRAIAHAARSVREEREERIRSAFIGGGIALCAIAQCALAALSL